MSERVASRLAEELRALDTAHVMATYARQPAAFVRGEGCDALRRRRRAIPRLPSPGSPVCNAGHCHPRVVEALREQAGRLLHASNLYLTRARARLAERLASSFERRREGVPCELRGGGERGGDQARAQAPPGWRDRRARRGVSRKDDGVSFCNSAGDQAGTVRAARPRLRCRSAGRCECAEGSGLGSNRRGDDRADSG